MISQELKPKPLHISTNCAWKFDHDFYDHLYRIINNLFEMHSPTFMNRFPILGSETAFLCQTLNEFLINESISVSFTCPYNEGESINPS